MNLARLLSERAALSRGKPAAVFEGTPYTFGAFDREVERYAGVLQRAGIGPGDRVAVQLPKRMEFLFAHFGALSLGAITLPLNADYRAEEVGYFLGDSRPSLMVTDRERSERSAGVLREAAVRPLLVDADPDRPESLARYLSQAPERFERPYAADGDDVAMLCYTSGTTGRSKAAMISHRNLISNTLALHSAWEWTDRDVLLHVLPLFHVHGLNVAATGSLYAGATMIMHERFEPRRVWDTLERERCTLLMAVPTIYQRLLAEWGSLGRTPDLSSLRVFISGSAPLSDPLFRRFESATGFRILERYGMSETGMNVSNPIEPKGRKPMSVGYPLPGVEIRIVSQEGGDVPGGDVGEVWIRGENVFRGYWEMPEKTAESFSNGWFRSGDLGYLDPSDGGRLYLVGRAKELIITGGYNVYPKEIENVLEAHEAVREAAVVGILDDEFGERVVAFVVPMESGRAPAPEELIVACKQKLAGYKCPKEVRYVEALPRNAMGKIQKSALR
ncbi:MAG: AMP-binding protein [Deltaproteobacteria bacterium]|nr:AMP-binding protein [Deltaproteobacteria bacterium]